MRAIDDAVLAALGEVVGVTICDGEVPLDASGNVSASVPYAVYYSDLGTPTTYRLSGRTERRTMSFQITYVGFSRNQAKAAGERVRSALVGERFADALCECEVAQQVRPDNDARTTDNRVLFYGVDQYRLVA